MNKSLIQQTPWTVGIARHKITPPLHVELAGFGYYLNRTAERVTDDLNATALVVGDAQENYAAFVAVDLMYADAEFTRAIRDQASSITGIKPEAICVNCSHSHNAPTAAEKSNRGVGEFDAKYVKSAAKTAAEVIGEAWKHRKPATLKTGWGEVKDFAFNRTRENGPIDTRVSALRADTLDGKPLAVLINHHTHLNAHLDANPRAISRDLLGEVVDQVESALPGSIALYLQGVCGDVMLRPEFTSTSRSFEPGRAIAQTVLHTCEKAQSIKGDKVRSAASRIQLPTRRWTQAEIMRDREEALYRLKTGDTTDWLNGFARVIVTYPARLPIRYGGSVEKAVAAVCRFGVEWTDAILPDLDTRPEYVETEVQAIRIGDVWFAANSAELFTSTGLEVRRRWPHPNLFLLGYSNGAIGYLPDAHDVERKSYAAYQSPKFTGQFPFTDRSATAMAEGLLATLRQTETSQKQTAAQ